METKRPMYEMEAKWQAEWEKNGVYHADEASSAETFYGLVEFPYPSGDGLHVGHVRSYTAIDAVTRKKRMEGKNVLYPMGWDAFGLPAENYAIKTKTPPAVVTQKNIDTFRRQLKSLGLGFDWSREVDTTDPTYYKWTQWQFLQFFKQGLAYKAKSIINWCPKCKIGLANEEAQGGVCERCGSPVEKREKEQWMIAITKYAERLLKDLDTVDYLDKIKVQQVNWIGKSEGAEVVFTLIVPNQPDTHRVKVFTTRPDTLFGATFLVISPEMGQKWLDVGWQASDEARSYIENALKKTEEDRSGESREKTGVFTGVMAINPATKKEIPVWIADYVLGNYGTGAIMAVPAHDERDAQFAEKYDLPSVHVVDEETTEAKQKMIEWLEKEGHGNAKVTYKLRDWVFSRQRYWGEPIPIIHCEKCGYVPVPDEQLPVVLPEVEAYEPTDTGESPLA
ncbi:leucine--tRNA ligase, partial [Candidatus Uhrbacteria bacterium]|nr:leucine--tRNA ligase [Candidatus Uhrbacteria bacterium]